MDDVFDNLNVVTVDGTKLEFSGVPRQMSLTRFRSLVAMRIQRNEGRYVPPADLSFMVFGEEMTDDNKTLAAYNIQDDDTITRVDAVGRNPFTQNVKNEPKVDNDALPPPYPGQGKVLKNIFVQDAHRTYTLNDVPLSTTIDELFTKIKQEKAVNTDSVGLIFGGKQLAKDRNLTLMDYDIQENSTIVLIVKLHGGYSIKFS